MAETANNGFDKDILLRGKVELNLCSQKVKTNYLKWVTDIINNSLCTTYTRDTLAV